MPLSHRPDIEAFTKETEVQRIKGTRFRDAFMWPYINQEDLLKPKVLLLFLNARSRSSPASFALADLNATHLGQVSKALGISFLNQYTMMFDGSERAEGYGRLYFWHEHRDAFYWMMWGLGVQPGEGLLILEIQERLYVFLAACCKKILHDLPEKTLMGEQSPTRPEPPWAFEHDTDALSMVARTSETPYRLPTKLDVGGLKSLLQAKLAEAEDHIWALREDPDYFAAIVLELKEHRSEMISDTTGKCHPDVRPGKDAVLWARVLSGVVVNAYGYLEIWEDLVKQVSNLEVLQAEHETNISSTEDLPEPYLEALLTFRSHLDHAVHIPIATLKQSVPPSPPLRRFFVREPHQIGTTKIVVTSKHGSPEDKLRSRLLWLFTTLWDDTQRFLFGLVNIVDEIGRLYQAETGARNLISPCVASVIGDLAVLAECTRQINNYQP